MVFLFRRLVFKELDRAGFHSCVRLYQEITIRTPKEIHKDILLETSGIHKEEEKRDRIVQPPNKKTKVINTKK